MLRVFCLCVCMYAILCIFCVEDEYQIPRTAITDSYYCHVGVHMYWVLSPGSLQGQQVPLTTEPSLQPQDTTSLISLDVVGRTLK